MTSRGTIRLCCVHILQLITHPAIYATLFTLQLCCKPLGILQRVTNSQMIHISNHDRLQNFITSTFNHVYNILSICDGWASFPFTTSERKCNKLVCTSCLYDFRKLGNIKKISKLYRLSAQSFSWNENFASTNKNLLKNRSWTFPMKTWVCLKYFLNDCCLA